MIGLARALAHIVRDLVKIFVGPRLCDACGLFTDRVTNRQFDAWRDSGGQDLPCKCGGQLRALLLVAAEAAVPLDKEGT